MIPDRWETAIEYGVLSGPVLFVAVAALVVGTVWVIRSRRLASRLVLVVGALLWPLPDHPFLGPVILTLSYDHGVHVADLLSVPALVLALTLRGRPPRDPEEAAAAASHPHDLTK